MKTPNAFVAIIDKNGDVWEIISKNASMQNIKYMIDHCNKNRPWSGPHEASLWNGAVWYPFKIR